MNPSIILGSGRPFNPYLPTGPFSVVTEIAPALSKLCRFTGHTRSFYSVAQHSVLVSYLCDPSHALAGLLHDASEAYLADIAAPMKRSPAFAQYRDLEAYIQRAIEHEHGIEGGIPADVQAADRLALAVEARDLMPAALRIEGVDPGAVGEIGRIDPAPPDRAERMFLDRWRYLIARPHHG